MRKKLQFSVLVLGASLAQASAQDNAARRGAETLGRAIAGRNHDAYYDQLNRVAEAELALSSALLAKSEAVLAKQQADAAEQDLKIMQMMKVLWMKQGLPENEATAIAYTFEWTAEFDAMLARARNVDTKTMADAARSAYKEYRYTQANQLLCAAYLAAAERNMKSEDERLIP